MPQLPISVVIITLNEARILGRTLQQVAKISDDIVVADTGSTDNTVAVALAANARIEHLSWEGFGKTKRAASFFAKHNWILFLDADEVPDNDLLEALRRIDLAKENVIYSMRFINFIGEQQMRFGEMHRFYKRRLYNRNVANWNEDTVHEALAFTQQVTEVKLPGNILHYSIPNLQVYAEKMTKYAGVMAEKKFKQGKQANFFQLMIYPSFLFAYTYVIKLGFLDGYNGYRSAALHAYYTALKYHRLHELVKQAETAGK